MIAIDFNFFIDFNCNYFVFLDYNHLFLLIDSKDVGRDIEFSPSYFDRESIASCSENADYTDLCLNDNIPFNKKSKVS